MCNKLSNYKLSINSYKGDCYFCESCFNQLQKILKRTTAKNEK